MVSVYIYAVTVVTIHIYTSLYEWMWVFFGVGCAKFTHDAIIH